MGKRLMGASTFSNKKVSTVGYKIKLHNNRVAWMERKRTKKRKLPCTLAVDLSHNFNNEIEITIKKNIQQSVFKVCAEKYTYSSSIIYCTEVVRQDFFLFFLRFTSTDYVMVSAFLTQKNPTINPTK